MDKAVRVNRVGDLRCHVGGTNDGADEEAVISTVISYFIV